MWHVIWLLMILPSIASAQDLVDTLRGLCGNASDPAWSCKINPHHMGFIANRPHLLLIRPAPWTNTKGHIETNRRFDLLSLHDTTVTPRDEYEQQMTDTGSRTIWILRHTTQPEGYCSGRTDWPQMRCQDQQLRCEAPVS